MNNVASTALSWAIWTILFLLMVSCGVVDYQIQAIPHYRETIERRIQTTGRLNDDDIKQLESDTGNKIIVKRLNYNEDTGKYSYASNNTSDEIEPYGTRVNYDLTVKAFGMGDIKIPQINDIIGFSVTEINNNDPELNND